MIVYQDNYYTTFAKIANHRISCRDKDRKKEEADRNDFFLAEYLRLNTYFPHKPQFGKLQLTNAITKNRLLEVRSRLRYDMVSSLEDFLFRLDCPVVVGSCRCLAVVAGTLIPAGTAVEATIATVSAGTAVIAAIKSASALTVPARATVITTGTAITSGA